MPYNHLSGIIPQLQNVVATVNLGCPLDLASIAQRARNAEYNPKRFAACIVRIRDPKTTALMFSSGKMVVAGAKSEEHSRLAARKYTKILKKLNFPVEFKEFTVQNMVASCSTKFPIRLEGFAAKFSLVVSYEPEVFPGLVFRMKDPKVVLLIFVTGKIVLTGAKKVTQIYDAFENIYPQLLDFRKGDARRIVQNGSAALPGPGTPAALPMPSDAVSNADLAAAGLNGFGIPTDVLSDSGNRGVPAPTPDNDGALLPTPMASGILPTPGTAILPRNIPLPTPGASTSLAPPPTPAPPPATPGPNLLPPPSVPSAYS